MEELLWPENYLAEYSAQNLFGDFGESWHNIHNQMLKVIDQDPKKRPLKIKTTFKKYLAGIQPQKKQPAHRLFTIEPTKVAKDDKNRAVSCIKLTKKQLRLDVPLIDVGPTPINERVSSYTKQRKLQPSISTKQGTCDEQESKKAGAAQKTTFKVKSLSLSQRRTFSEVADILQKAKHNIKQRTVSHCVFTFPQVFCNRVLPRMYTEQNQDKQKIIEERLQIRLGLARKANNLHQINHHYPSSDAVRQSFKPTTSKEITIEPLEITLSMKSSQKITRREQKSETQTTAIPNCLRSMENEVYYGTKTQSRCSFDSDNKSGRASNIKSSHKEFEIPRPVESRKQQNSGCISKHNKNFGKRLNSMLEIKYRLRLKSNPKVTNMMR